MSKEIKCRPDTVMDWVHKYNAKGHDDIVYKRTEVYQEVFEQAENFKQYH